MNALELALLVFSLVTLARAGEEDVDYYVDLITKWADDAYTYVLPTNAEEYRSTGKRQTYGEYDFVIVGSGAGGSIVARRLSEITSWSILLLEAGTPGEEVLNFPHLYSLSFFSKFNWAFNSTPQTTACQGMVNKVCAYPRGRGLGGSTLISGLAYVRGYKSDYNKWADLVGDNRWNCDSVLKLFKRTENFVLRDPAAPYDPDFHGEGGPLRVEQHLPRTPQADAFFEANRELGYNIVDYNANKIGASPEQLNMVNGTRLDAARAFLEPVRDRKNLKVLPESYVTRIRFDKATATGVEFDRKGKKYFVRARKEVILCAGAFGSAQILMLSGVGPRDHLRKLNISLVADLEVGTSLRDNSAFYGLPISTNYSEPVRSLKEYVEEYLNGLGLLTLPNNNQGVGFYESSYTKGTGVPDIELIFEPANATSSLIQKVFGLTDETFEDLWKYVDYTKTINFQVVNLHTESVGTVRLKSKNPYDYPLIDSNFISDPDNRDINVLIEAIELVLQILQTKPFRAVDAKLSGTGLRACRQYTYPSREYWLCALRQVTVNLYHPVGTCAMGKDPKEGAVVDSKLRVFGLKNLRVADASVIPLTMACHTSAPATMVGEQLSDLIIEKYINKN